MRFIIWLGLGSQFQRFFHLNHFIGFFSKVQEYMLMLIVKHSSFVIIYLTAIIVTYKSLLIRNSYLVLHVYLSLSRPSLYFYLIGSGLGYRFQIINYPLNFSET